MLKRPSGDREDIADFLYLRIRAKVTAQMATDEALILWN